MKKIILSLAFISSIGLAGNLKADCYGCRSESKDSNGKRIHYCKFTGSDSSSNRKTCEDLGCKISTSPTSCPSAANYNVVNAN